MSADAVLEVNLSQLDANLARIREVLGDDTSHMLVVKNDAYGHGVEEVVRRACSGFGISWIGAFDVETARRVRAVAPADTRVFVWVFPDSDAVRDSIELDCELGVGDFLTLSRAIELAGEVGTIARLHLKIDTGLNRNGFRAEAWHDALRIVAEAVAKGRARLEGIWTHISEASDEEDDFARARFDEAVAHAAEHGLTPTYRHLAASAASFARGEFRYDLARIGAFAYGIRPDGGPSDEELGIRPISTLRARVVAEQDDSLVIGIGAADGLPSSLSGALSALTASGDLAPVTKIRSTTSLVGRAAGVDIGDFIAVYGRDAAMGPTDCAELIDTIGEEIAVRLSRTIPRSYSS